MPYTLLAAAFLVIALFTATGASAEGVTPYPRPPGDEANPHYAVTVNGIPVDAVTTPMQVGYAHFAIEGVARIQVTASEPIQSYDLSPHRLNIDATVDGRTLSFEIDRPRKLHLRINGLPRFFLLADPPETRAPTPGDAGVFLLTDFGVTSSPESIQTEAIQRAIDAAAASRGTLYVPPGIYRTGSLDLRSGLSIYLAPGAILKGTANLDDYPRGRGGHVQLLLVDASNTRIYGRGVIDANGKAMRDQFLPDRRTGRAKMLVAHNSHNLVIEDVILRDAGVWCIHARQSRDMRFSNLKIISVARSETGPDTSHNTDAFDPDNSSNILIENNFISVDDDAIAVKLTGGERADMSNIVFRDNVVWTMCSAMKIGTEVMGGFTVRDVLFENNDVIHAESAIVVQSYRGGYVDGARWIGNYVERIAAVPNNSPHAKHAGIYINTRSEDNFGGARNLLIKDNTFERFGPSPSMIRANGPTQVVDGVVIENLVIEGEKRASADAAQLLIDPDVRNVEFK